MEYSTFLGGTGDESAQAMAVDSNGNVYLAGTTTSASTFPAAATATLAPGGGTNNFFVAKINPSASGAASLVYLAFIGGNGAETGGAMAVDAQGAVILAGATTSPDYPTTDGSKLSTGGNSLAISKIDATGAKLRYVVEPVGGARPRRMAGIGATLSPERVPAKVRNPPIADPRQVPGCR